MEEIGIFLLKIGHFWRDDDLNRIINFRICWFFWKILRIYRECSGTKAISLRFFFLNKIVSHVQKICLQKYFYLGRFITMLHILKVQYFKDLFRIFSRKTNALEKSSNNFLNISIEKALNLFRWKIVANVFPSQVITVKWFKHIGYNLRTMEV